MPFLVLPLHIFNRAHINHYSQLSSPGTIPRDYSTRNENHHLPAARSTELAVYDPGSRRRITASSAMINAGRECLCHSRPIHRYLRYVLDSWRGHGRGERPHP